MYNDRVLRLDLNSIVALKMLKSKREKDMSMNILYHNQLLIKINDITESSGKLFITMNY